MASLASSTPSVRSNFENAFPNSRKVYVAGESVRVPMREISLSDGEAVLRVYDTSGPHDTDVRSGLPPLRQEWIASRGDVVEVPLGERKRGTGQIPSSLRRPVVRGIGPVTLSVSGGSRKRESSTWLIRSDRILSQGKLLRSRW